MFKNDPLKIEDICLIIKTCSSHAVKKISYKGLSIDFYTNVATPVIEPAFVSEELQQKQDSQAREALSSDELQVREEELSQLAIEDPVRYEKMLMSGDLNNG